MEISYPLLALLGFATLSFYHAYNLYRRIRLLKSAGIPYIIVPFPESPLKYQVLRGLPPYKAFVKYLLKPLGLGGYHDYQVRDWRLHRREWVKDFGFGKFGNIYCQLSLQSMQLEIADREFVKFMSGKEGRMKFGKPKWQYRALDIYGENVVSSDDAHWGKHRRVTAPAYNDRTSVLVWQASINQFLQMQYHWTSRESGNTKRLFTKRGDIVINESGEDTKKLTLNVLSLIAFGLDIPYTKSYFHNLEHRQQSSQTEPIEAKNNSLFDPEIVFPGFSMSFEKALHRTTENFQFLLLFVLLWPFWDNKNKDGIQTLPKPKFVSFLSESLKANIAGWLDVGRYLGTLIDLERQSVLSDNQHQGVREERDNLLSLTVQRSMSLGYDNHQKAGNVGLTLEELVGNAYIFAFSGHETTASTIEYALVLLSLFQEAQNWFLMALDEELADVPEDPREWKFELFQKLVSCKCLMFEVLRLFPPVQTLTRWIDPQIFPNGTTVMLPIRDSLNAKATEWKSFHFPTETFFYLNSYGLHYNPDYWGPDVNEFRPSRWDASRDSQRKEWLAQYANSETEAKFGDSTHTEPGVYTPSKGQYIPFGFAHRACLGKKFSMVEFTAVIALLFRHWRVDLADSSGREKTREELERHAWQKIRQTTGGITTRIAKHVPLKLIRRKYDGNN